MKKYFVGLGIIVFILIVMVLHHDNKSATMSVAKPTKLYVAMGDSVAAGDGLKYDSDSSACDRTNQSYPNQVASALNYKLDNFACSSATLPAGILGKQDVNDLLVSPQLQQLFAQPKPSLITLTIGANDAQWTKILGECYSGECSAATDQAAVTANLTMVKTNLETALTQIKTEYGATPPHVIVTGYYQVFPANVVASCTDLTGIDTSELSWGHQLQTSISSTLQQAVNSYSFAAFVPINFAGHELCTADPWVQGLADAAPYHPTQAGQAQIAKAIEATVKELK